MIRMKWPMLTAIVAMALLVLCVSTVPVSAQATTGQTTITPPIIPIPLPLPPTPWPPQTHVYNMTDNGKTVTQGEGTIFYVELPTMSGFQWKLSVTPGLKILDNGPIMPMSQSTTSKGYETWKIEAVKPGSNTVTAYETPEKGSMLPIIIAYKLHVNVLPPVPTPTAIPLPTVTPLAN